MNLVKALQSLAARRAAHEAVAVPPPQPLLIQIGNQLVLQLEPFVPPSIKYKVLDFCRDKSTNELLFLSCVLAVVLFFAVVLPLYDTLFDELDVHQEDLRKLRSACDSKLKNRRGVGVVEVDAQDVAKRSIMCDRSCCRSSPQSSRRRCSRWTSRRGSISLLQSIEESEEEYEDSDDESDASGDSTGTPTITPPSTPDQTPRVWSPRDMEELKMKLEKCDEDGRYVLPIFP